MAAVQHGQVFFFIVAQPQIEQKLNTNKVFDFDFISGTEKYTIYRKRRLSSTKNANHEKEEGTWSPS